MKKKAPGSPAGVQEHHVGDVLAFEPHRRIANLSDCFSDVLVPLRVLDVGHVGGLDPVLLEPGDERLLHRT